MSLKSTEEKTPKSHDCFSAHAGRSSCLSFFTHIVLVADLKSGKQDGTNRRELLKIGRPLGIQNCFRAIHFTFN